MGAFAKIGQIFRSLWLPTQDQQLTVQTAQTLASPALRERIKRSNALFFMADAPDFIDSALVGRLYEAVFQPEFEVSSRSSGQTRTRGSELSAELAASGGVSVPTMLKIEASTKGGMKDTWSGSGSVQIVETAISSPERRLEKLLNLYFYSYPNRFFTVGGDLVTVRDFNDAILGWGELELALDQNGPRPLIVFDLQPGAKLIPMFAELSGGKPVPVYKNLIAALGAAERVPKYPNFGTPDYEMKNKEYWSALSNVFESEKAMTEVEAATKDGGKLEWIDFRIVGVKADGQPEPIHLHLSPRGGYPSGTFGYQFIRRAEKYGLRIVGRLKKGSDVDVLAFYQR